MKKVYVGPKQKTIENSKFFDYSITLFGDNKDNNISYQENSIDKILDFEYWNPDSNPKEIKVYNVLLKKIKEPCEIMAHDYKIVSNCKIPNNYKLICKNEDILIDLFNNKEKTRNLFNKIVPMLDYQYISGGVFNFNKISKNNESLVVQHPLGSGGSKTFLFTKNNYKELTKYLLKDEIYIVSKYMKDNTPYNINCVIGKNNYIIFPPSIQGLDINEKIEYIDSFYDIEISKEIKNKFYEYTCKICSKLKDMGYLGVLGIDYIYTNNELYFIEINPRFQGSSRKLDKILIDNNYPSIFEYNYLAFYNDKLVEPKKLKNYIGGDKI